MKILLIGRTGQLGGSILEANRSHHIVAPPRSELDLGSPESFEQAVLEHRPEAVINTAAFHNVPRCEVEPNRAFEINCVAIRNLADICRKADTKLITFSSDYVFGGDQTTPYTEDAPTNPLQMYGISRLAGELAALNSAPNHAIVIRTCGLYGLSGARSKGGNFVDQRIRDAQTHTSLEMGCDQTVSPTYSGDLARATLQLIEHPRLVPGLYHLVNEGECSWYEFTKAIYQDMGIDISVQPVDRGGMSGTMRRPLYSVLANKKARHLGIQLPHWRNALERFLAKKYG